LRRIRRALLAVFLLAIAGYAIWGRVESKGLGREIAAIEARGEPITTDTQPAQQTDDQRQAALLYATAAERVQEMGREGGFQSLLIDVDRVGAPAPDLSQLESIYRKDSPPLQLLDQASLLDFNGFGTVAPEFSSNQAPLVSLGALNALRADLLSRRHDAEGAIAALVASVRLLRAIPTSFYRFQADSRLLGSIRILLRHTPPDARSLLALQREVERLPDEDGVPREVMQRRAEFLESLDLPRRSMFETLLVAAGRPVVTHFTRAQLSRFDEVLAVARLPWPGKLAAAEALRQRYFDPAQSRSRGVLRNLAEQLSSSHAVSTLFVETAGLDLATRRILITVLAVERYRRAHAGAAPPALDALVPAFMTAVPQDPFSGKPLVYKQDAAGYLLYSIDINHVDDGGVLYGLGAMATTGPRGTQSRRDYGIRVPRHSGP
jgi:hypothetical protein